MKRNKRALFVGLMGLAVISVGSGCGDSFGTPSPNDSDGDRVFDRFDRCQLFAGSEALDGCPAAIDSNECPFPGRYSEDAEYNYEYFGRFGYVAQPFGPPLKFCEPDPMIDGADSRAFALVPFTQGHLIGTRGVWSSRPPHRFKGFLLFDPTYTSSDKNDWTAQAEYVLQGGRRGVVAVPFQHYPEWGIYGNRLALPTDIVSVTIRNSIRVTHEYPGGGSSYLKKPCPMAGGVSECRFDQ